MHSRDGGSHGCELAYPNDDGFFVSPITGIIWDSGRHMKNGGDEDEGEGEGEAADYEGGSKSFCNMVTQGYECEKDPFETYYYEPQYDNRDFEGRMVETQKNVKNWPKHQNYA